MDRRIVLFFVGGLVSLAMYPVVSPLDSANPAKPEHYGAFTVVLAAVYGVLVVILLLEGMSRRRQRPRGDHPHLPPH